MEAPPTMENDTVLVEDASIMAASKLHVAELRKARRSGVPLMTATRDHQQCKDYQAIAASRQRAVQEYAQRVGSYREDVTAAVDMNGCFVVTLSDRARMTQTTS